MRRGFRPAAERPWLYRIAENVCADRQRANGRRGRHEATDGAKVLELIPARDSQTIEGLDEALAGLTPLQRQALLLREWQGLSYREIASELQLSKSAVETLLFRARRTLAKRLEAVPLIPWLKSALFGSSAKTVAAVAVTVGVGTAAVAPLVVERSREPAQHRPSTPVAPERVGDLRSVVRRPVEQLAPPTVRTTGIRIVRPVVHGPASKPAPTPRATTATPSAHHTPAPSESPAHGTAPAPKAPAPTVPELPVDVPSLPIPEVPLPEPSEVPVLGPVVAPVQEVVHGVLPELPARLP
jgi:Sigma-70, region 4